MKPCLKFLIFAASLTICEVSSAKLPEIQTYAKVTKNGEEEKTSINNNQQNPISWIMTAFSLKNNKTEQEFSEGRSSNPDVLSITVSPVYVPPKIPELNKGEAVDYPPTKSYSTLDEEMLARIDYQKSNRKQQAQERFHPPAIFQHDVAHANAAKSKLKQTSGPSGPPSGPSQDSSQSLSSTFPGVSYDYKSPNFINDKPITVDGYSTPDSFPKAPISFDSSSISFGPPPSSSSSNEYSPPADYPNHDHDHDHHHDHHHHDVLDFDPELTHEIHASDYGSKPVYTAPKAIEYAGNFDHPAYVDDPYIHDDHHYHHHHHEDIIYDHIPDDHTTMAPEQMDKRLNQRPYSYYFIGKKLWYIPLYFSIYFIFYIAALILKSIARHKINFPTNLSNALSTSSKRSIDGMNSDQASWLDLTFRVLDGIEKVRKTLSKKS